MRRRLVSGSLVAAGTVKGIGCLSDAVDGVPLNKTLSRISPNNPVLLGHASGHAAFANDAALAAAGITDSTPIQKAARLSVTARVVPPACCEKLLSSWSPKQRRMIGPGVP